MESLTNHSAMQLGPVYLKTADLERLVRFYQTVIGFRMVRRVDDRVYLGTPEGKTLLVLTGRADVTPKPRGATGLYHFAILQPTRRDLARSLRRLAQVAYPLQGASDHLVSEAIYLADPDGNGIELCADRPRRDWRWHDGFVEMATVPLNQQALLNEIANDDAIWRGLPDGTRIGHIHLHVGDLVAAEAFYGGQLGFALTARYGAGAAFMSADGYHHHIGLNTWAGANAPSPPATASGLDYFTLYMPKTAAYSGPYSGLAAANPDTAEGERAEPGGVMLRDPAGNRILLVINTQEVDEKTISG